MTIKEQISNDIKAAMKAADSVKTTVLRGILSASNNKVIEKRTKAAQGGQAGNEETLTDEEMLQVIMTESKKRNDAIALYKQGGRQDLVDQETKELAIIQVYLPKQLSEDEVRAAVSAIVAKAGVKEFGPVMKEAMKELKGKADAQLVTKYIKEALNG